MNLIKKQHNFLPLVFDNFFRDTWDIMPAIRNNSPATNIKESDKDFIIENMNVHFHNLIKKVVLKIQRFW